jgi:NAD(P)-dependent dehydrogenase (short-subunit alcohol dehydrogenase family)
MALAVIEKMGGLDILVNCAGIIFDGDVLKTFPQDFDYLMDINLRCAFHMILIFQKYLEASSGCVINVSCSWGTNPIQNYFGYSMTKAGLEMLTKCAALELAPLGIRVNAVSVSTVDTNLYLYMGMNDAQYNRFKDEAGKTIPLKSQVPGVEGKVLEHRVANVAEISNAIIFLSSELALKITGHIMKVDGGKSLTSSDYKPPAQSANVLEKIGSMLPPKRA